MPHSNYKTVINAPYDQVSALLAEKMELPKKYVGAILWSRIVERGEGYILREMYQPKPADLLVREKIYYHQVPNGEEYVYEHVNNARYTGQFRNILTRITGRDDQCELEYRMEWDPHVGTEEQITAETADRMVRPNVLHIKELAENPVMVPDWVREWYAKVDSLDADSLHDWLADDVCFRFGNGNDVIGRDAVTEINRDIFSRMKSMKHNFIEIYEDRGKTLIEALVNYELPTGESYLLPMLTTKVRRNGMISNVRIYGDVSPLRSGWQEH